LTRLASAQLPCQGDAGHADAAACMEPPSQVLTGRMEQGETCCQDNNALTTETLTVPIVRRLRIADPEQDARVRTLEDLVAVRVVRISEVLTRLATHTIEARVGLRNTDLRLMNLLDGFQGVTVNEIARRAHVDKAWVSRSLRELEKNGLVTRKSHNKDSRLTVVDLSAKGRALLEEVRPLAVAREARLLDGIDPIAFKASLDRLMLNAERMLEQT
jgi:DNA-binding MarR family transcriptional regulator